MSKAMAMAETATSEVLGKCMINESAYVCFFRFGKGCCCLVLCL